jgi:FtsJ-like methyltransferase
MKSCCFLWPHHNIFLLQVFDPRRTDPVHFGEVVGKCLVCGTQHDDYDNGHSPNDNCEARCNKCRMLVLICNECRPNWRCHGEKADGGDEGDTRPLLYCNIHYCIHEGAAPEPTLVFGKGNKEPSNHFETFDNDHVCRAYHKLKEAWERYKFDPPSYQECASSCLVAIDCGAAPGGWSEFLLQKIRCSRVFAVDPAQLSENLSQDERLRYISMKIQDALPLIRQELLGSRSPVSIWVCDMNCRELSFPIDCLLEARRLGLVGAGTFFVLTLKLVKGHTVTTFEMLVQKQVQRLLNGLEDCRFEKVQVLHLFSNRIRERTVMGYCA